MYYNNYNNILVKSEYIEHEYEHEYNYTTIISTSIVRVFQKCTRVHEYMSTEYFGPRYGTRIHVSVRASARACITDQAGVRVFQLVTRNRL